MLFKLSLATLLFVGSVSCIDNEGPQSGQATWYHVDQNGAKGACGQMHHDDGFYVAPAFGTYDNFEGANPGNPNNNPICGKNLKATYEGKSVVVTVVDRCASCMNSGDIDLSPTAFQALADLSVGVLPGVQWEWTDLPAGLPSDNNGTASSPEPSEPNNPAEPNEPNNPAGPNEPNNPAEPSEPNVTRRMLRARRPSVSHEAIEEPISRREKDAGVEMRARAAASSRSVPDNAEAVVERSKKEAERVVKPFERRFKMPEPIRLRRIYDAIQERDAMKAGR